MSTKPMIRSAKITQKKSKNRVNMKKNNNKLKRNKKSPRKKKPKFSISSQPNMNLPIKRLKYQTKTNKMMDGYKSQPKQRKNDLFINLTISHFYILS